MRYFHLLAAFLLMLTAPCCTTKGAQTSTINQKNSALFKTWLQSSEEEKYHGDHFYRPKNYKFPTSGARKGFTIYADGRFIEHVKHQEKGMINVAGIWEMRNDKTLVIRFPDGSRQHYLLEIKSLEPDMLKVDFNYRLDGSAPDPAGPVVPY